jgi:hypothetical protein
VASPARAQRVVLLPLRVDKTHEAKDGYDDAVVNEPDAPI